MSTNSLCYGQKSCVSKISEILKKGLLKLFYVIKVIMNNQQESRRFERINFFSQKFDEFNIQDIYFIIESEEKSRGEIADLSPSGLGILMRGRDRDWYKQFDGCADFFIKLYIGSEVIIAGVKMIWNSATFERDEILFRAGLKFVNMSGEDRLTLSGIINKIRNKSVQ